MPGRKAVNTSNTTDSAVPKVRRTRTRAKKACEEELAKIDTGNCGDVTINDNNVIQNEENGDNEKKNSLKQVEQMETVKALIQSLDKNRQITLLRAVLRVSTNEWLDNLDEFKSQTTQNQNGIFLNLTTCSDWIWNNLKQEYYKLNNDNRYLEVLEQEQENVRRMMSENNKFSDADECVNTNMNINMELTDICENDIFAGNSSI